MRLIDKLRKQKLLSSSLILFTLSIGILIGTLINTGVRAAKESPIAPGATPLVIPNATPVTNQFSALATKLAPSVVHVSTAIEETPRTGRNRRRPMPEEEGEDSMQDFFNRFFGNPFGESPFPRRSAALGSGVIIDSNGYILTNHHVTEKATRIRIKMVNDSREYDAKVIGSDSETDLAVLKIDAGKQLPAAKIGNSDAVNVGDWAIAIGSPFGLQTTVTVGIISAKDRPGTTTFQNFLQTDAAINPGNSGGPLLNVNGEVIGINTAIATRTGGYEGIGFSLPINTAAKVYNQIIKSGKVSRGSIGVEFAADDSRNEELLKAYGASSGVFVQRVIAGGPAEKAGLQAEDIIVAIDGRQVKNGQELIARVSETPIGNQMTVTVLRNNRKTDLKLTVGDRVQVVRDRLGGQSSEESPGGEATPAKFGVTIENMTPAVRDSMNFEASGGVLVRSVEPGSFAEDIGILPNDVIMAINRQPVNSVDDVKRIQETLKPGMAVAVRVMRAARAVPGRGARAAEWTSMFFAGTLPNTPRQ
ncbi:MAG: Do family serine endopeptidase [Bryobacterales bacterium]|nr:Do family serine endopeptidase [Bryobacterales bacterium]